MQQKCNWQHSMAHPRKPPYRRKKVEKHCSRLTFAKFQTATPSLLISVHHSTCALFVADAARQAGQADIKNSLSATSRLMHFLHTRDDITLKKSRVAEIPPCYVPSICWNGGNQKPRSRRSINSAVEAAVMIALGQSIGSVRIYSVQSLGFEFSCMQTFCNFFSLHCHN